MSLPPGFLDELRTRLSLVQVVGRKVMWDTRKSNQGKGDMWAPCPFHQEKSASFHVDDRKGFYYCFGCHAKGDAISFVRETENLGFMEAIELLARETGMQVPARDPQAQVKADRRTQLAEVMEQAVQYYRLQLKTGAAAQARDYLAGRGLDEAAQARWDIGFAPDMRQGVFNALTGKSVPPDLIIDAGLAAKPDDGGAPYDRFRGRIIFPIRDGRGRAIALGGRAMDPNARAKYLNSPETELFDKGRSLYNQGPAREAAGKGKPLLVAEGYMDVIALSEAGFTATVAPLGTAITENQLQLLWRISPEPIIALDGDTAGLRAAMRLIDIALPLLEAGKSLRFCLMPTGQDPDDVVRKAGAGAMQKLIDQAQPLVQLLWRRETEDQVFDSPERKAALDKRLRDAIMKITDPNLRSHYGQEVKQLRWALFAPKRTNKPNRGSSGGYGSWSKAPLGPMPGTRQSSLATAPAEIEDSLREAVILAILISQPELVQHFETKLEDMDCSLDDHRRLRAALLRHVDTDPTKIREKIIAETGLAPLENIMSQSHIAIIPALRNPGDFDLAMTCVGEELAKLAAKRGAEREIGEAVEDIVHLADEGLTWRLDQAAQARHRAESGQTEDKTEYDTAPSGAKIKRDERSAFDALLKGINYAKTRN